jgi:hypothetical protein
VTAAPFVTLATILLAPFDVHLPPVSIASARVGTLLNEQLLNPPIEPAPPANSKHATTSNTAPPSTICGVRDGLGAATA